MKKLLTIACLFLAITFIARQARAQVDFGIRAGVNFSTLYNTFDDVDTQTGLLAGVYLQIPVSNNFIIQPELLYSAKGVEDEEPAGAEVFHLNYITVPLFLKYKFTLQGALTPYIAAGPYIAYLTDNYVTRDGKTVTEEVSAIRDYDIGASIGAGLEYSGFNFGVRYSIGFVPIGTFETVDDKNKVFSIVAGFTF